MSGRAIVVGIVGLFAVFMLMFWSGAFMRDDAVEPSIQPESAE